MLRHKVTSSVEVEWTFVSAKRPCTVCGGHHGCRRGFAGEFACCTSVFSEWPLMAGGWIHRLELLSQGGDLLDSSTPRQRDSSEETLRTGSSR